MKSKECFKCNQTKPLSEFYKHKAMPDGHVNKCKECNKKDVQKNYRVNIDHFKEYDKNRAMLPHRVEARKSYVATPNGKKAVYRGTKRYRKLNPEKYKATNLVCKAVANGKLTKQSCVLCGSKKVHAHHDDYLKPLDVVWLCPRHHTWLHRALRETL